MPIKEDKILKASNEGKSILLVTIYITAWEMDKAVRNGSVDQLIQQKQEELKPIIEKESKQWELYTPPPMKPIIETTKTATVFKVEGK